jgi:diguanylate cyclase (GGDEF)-like protein
VLTGLVTFLLAIIILSLTVQRYVLKPLQQLGAGFGRIGIGDFDHWVEVHAGGEIQEMADQFNVMSQALKRSFSEIKHKNWEIGQLYVFVQQLSQASGWRKLRRIITNLVFETFGADRVALFLLREQNETEVMEIAWRQAGDPRYYHQEHHIVPEEGQLPDWIMDAWKQWHRHPAMAPSFSADDAGIFLPLASKNAALGLLCLQRESSRPFSKMEKKLLLAVSEQICVVLANAQLYRMATTDGLTGLYTKRYCESVIKKFMDAQDADPHLAFNVLMLDLDHFKRVNDIHGHQTGDKVLMQLADLILSHIRYDDVACRYGGEEFIMLVTGDMSTGLLTAERLCRAVAEFAFQGGGGLTLGNTISIGVANFPEHGKTAAEVIGAADQALYEAKDGGRNQVKGFSPLKQK